MTTKSAQADSRRQSPEVANRVEEAVRKRLTENSPHAFHFRSVTCRWEAGVLILNGEVPTFYMKQLLQTRLRGIEHVREIDNRVAVVG